MKWRTGVAIGLVCIGAGLLITGETVGLTEATVERVARVMGGGIAVVGVAVFVRNRRRPRERWEPDAPERGVTVPAPGDDLLAEGEPAVRQRFRARVIEALVAGDYDRQGAETAVAHRRWTYNRRAARYLDSGDTPGRSWVVRAAARLTSAVLPDGWLGNWTREGILRNRRSETLEQLRRLRDRDE